MSEGPIKSERDGWKAIQVSTPNSKRVCFNRKGVGYCGRTSAKTMTAFWSEVVCWDCTAAALADGVRVPTKKAAA